jgi:hypothetical protein
MIRIVKDQCVCLALRTAKCKGYFSKQTCSNIIATYASLVIKAVEEYGKSKRDERNALAVHISLGFPSREAKEAEPAIASHSR